MDVTWNQNQWAIRIKDTCRTTGHPNATLQITFIIFTKLVKIHIIWLPQRELWHNRLTHTRTFCVPENILSPEPFSPHKSWLSLTVVIHNAINAPGIIVVRLTLIICPCLAVPPRTDMIGIMADTITTDCENHTLWLPIPSTMVALLWKPEVLKS